MIVERPPENPGRQENVQQGSANHRVREKIVREEDDNDLVDMNVNELEGLEDFMEDDMVDLSDGALNDIIGPDGQS